MTKTRARRHVVVVDNRPLARSIGRRIRAARERAGLSQRVVAADRFSASYISALENGTVKPSMSALAFLAERLGCTINDLVGDPASSDPRAGRRLEADLRLAAGDWTAALDIYDDLLSANPTERERAELQRGAAEALSRLGKPLEAIDRASESVVLFERADRKLDALQARYWLGAAHYQAQNSDEARAVFGGILDQLHAGTDASPDFRGRVLIALANSEIWSGNAKAAAAYLEEARSIADEMDDQRRATFLLSLALSYRDSGDLEGAVRVGQRSLALFSALDARREEVTLENSLALAYLGLGSTAKAASHARRAKELARQIDAADLEAHITDTLAQVAIARRDWPSAIDLASQAVARAERDGNEHALVDGLLSRARATAAQGDQDAAAADLRRAAEAATRVGANRQRRAALTELGELLASRGQHEEAVKLYREVVRLE